MPLNKTAILEEYERRMEARYELDTLLDTLLDKYENTVYVDRQKIIVIISPKSFDDFNSTTPSYFKGNNALDIIEKDEKKYFAFDLGRIAQNLTRLTNKSRKDLHSFLGEHNIESDILKPGALRFVVTHSYSEEEANNIYDCFTKKFPAFASLDDQNESFCTITQDDNDPSLSYLTFDLLEMAKYEMKTDELGASLSKSLQLY